MRRRRTLALGISSPLISPPLCLYQVTVPDQLRIEALRSENGEDHHAGEREQPRSRHHAGEIAELDQRYQDREQEHVEHRPRTDDVQEAVDFRTAAQAPALAQFRAHDQEENLPRSEEHTSELQSHSDLVCRLLLEKQKNLCDSFTR